MWKGYMNNYFVLLLSFSSLGYFASFFISVKLRWKKNELYLERHETYFYIFFYYELRPQSETWDIERRERDKKKEGIVISIIFNTLTILKTQFKLQNLPCFFKCSNSTIWVFHIYNQLNCMFNYVLWYKWPSSTDHHTYLAGAYKYHNLLLICITHSLFSTNFLYHLFIFMPVLFNYG
jgi:hypothetical protein